MVQGLLNQIDCNHVVSRDDLNLVVSACLNFWFCCLENSHLIYADYFEMKLKKLLKDDY